MKSQGLSEQQICVIFAVCHATGMLSACANPIIYGFLNENFKTEFKEIYKILKSKLACCFVCCKRSENNNQNNLEQEEEQQQQQPQQQIIEMAPLMNNKEIPNEPKKSWLCVFYKKSDKSPKIETNDVWCLVLFYQNGIAVLCEYTHCVTQNVQNTQKYYCDVVNRFVYIIF